MHRFVTIDGPGGAGKSTTARRAVEILESLGVSAIYTREPSESDLGRFLRDNFGKMKSYALAALIAADRFNHIGSVITPALEEGKVVVCDRYVPSSLVLQPFDGVPSAYVEALNAPALQPDLAILLTADPATLWSRISYRGSHGRFEETADQSTAECAAFQQVWGRVESLGWNVVSIDASMLGIDEVAAGVVNSILGEPADVG